MHEESSLPRPADERRQTSEAEAVKAPVREHLLLLVRENNAQPNLDLM